MEIKSKIRRRTPLFKLFPKKNKNNKNENKKNYYFTKSI